VVAVLPFFGGKHFTISLILLIPIHCNSSVTPVTGLLELIYLGDGSRFFKAPEHVLYARIKAGDDDAD
jgi:hypothetical protein